jgi:hypothetical protein
MTDAPTFPLSQPPEFEEGQYVKSAAMLVIGDEVLNGELQLSSLLMSSGELGVIRLEHVDVRAGRAY